VRLALLLLLAGCQRLAPPETGGDSSPAPEPFEETLDPDALHLLATGLPSTPAQDSIFELDLAFEQRWSFGLLQGGVQGAWRTDDGDTVFAASTVPPELSSSIVRIEADGTLVWDYDHLFIAGLGFSHGVVATPDGDWIALDTTGGQLIGFDEAGDELWSYALHEHGEGGSPNGVAIHDAGDGTALLAVSTLERAGAPQRLLMLELSGREAPPVERWAWDLDAADGLLFPHGPRFTDDGHVLVCLSSVGQVVALDLDGVEQWRVPADHRASALSFPRDAWFLPDGTLMVADGANELLRVHDPHGAFEVVASVRVPDVFSVHPVVCGPDGGLPCLGG